MVNETTHHSRIRTRFNPGAAALWASAFVIAAMVVVQAGRLPMAAGANAAHADVTASRGSYTLLTADSGRGSDDANKLLYVIDSREQVLLVYEIEDARRNMMFLRTGGSLENLFNSARQ